MWHRGGELWMTAEPLTCWKNTYLHEFAIRTALEVNCAWDGYRLWLTLCYEKHGLRRGNGIIAAWMRTRVMSSHKTGHERFSFFLAVHWKDYFSHSVVTEWASEEECILFSLFLCASSPNGSKLIDDVMVCCLFWDTESLSVSHLVSGFVCLYVW